MKLIKYATPGAPIDRLFEGLDWGFPMIDRFFHDAETAGADRSAVRLPRTNIREADDSFVLTMEMPGLDKKDVSVNIEGDTLVVKGEISQQHEEKGLLRREYRCTRFERTFSVNGVDRDGVHAKMENGILTVTLAKTPEKVGRQIEIA